MKNPGKLVELTADLMNFPSDAHNPKARKDIVDFVQKQFLKERVFVKRYDRKGFPSLVINLRRERDPFLILNGHLDVVPAEKKDFKAKVKNNRIYGRGGADMKAACAVMIEAVKYFSKFSRRPSVGLMLTTDEETGGHNGVRYLLEEKKYKSDLALIPDGGSGLQDVTINQKGVLHVKIKARGKAAHGSMPFLGDNALDKLIKIYTELRDHIPELRTRKWENSMSLGRISGGDAVNKIPDYAEMYLDIRFKEKHEMGVILRRLKKIARNFEIINGGHPVVQDKDDPYVKKYKKVTENVLKKKIVFKRSEGASDARYFSEKKIPTIITALKGKNVHAKNEWVDIREMSKFQDILINFISALRI